MNNSILFILVTTEETMALYLAKFKHGLVQLPDCALMICLIVFLGMQCLIKN